MTQELRKLAEAATQGEWVYQYTCIGHTVRQSPDAYSALLVANGSGDPESDATYIAAANPAAILALLDRLEEAEKDAARLDWVIRNRDMRVQGDDHRGWHVLDCSDGLTFVVREEGSFRSAIDSAMEASKCPTQS